MITVEKRKYADKRNDDKLSFHLELSGFKDEVEQEVWLEKIQRLIKDNSGRMKVF